nr:hypothetical protein [Candidatus Poseidoniales archaeon]
GVMTHHGSNLHIHAIIQDGDETITGHLDAIEMAPGSNISVPVIGNQFTGSCLSLMDHILCKF